MSIRWVRLFVVIAVAASIGLAGGGVAQADSAWSSVRAGSAEAASRGTTTGIALIDRVTGRYVDNGTNAHRRFGSASLVKLFIADSVLRRARLGQIKLSQTDRIRVAAMLKSSNDAAASNLWGRFGGSAIVKDVARRYGLTEIRPPANPRYWGLTQVTAHDLAEFYTKMLSGKGGLAAKDRDVIVRHLRAATARGSDGVYQWFGLHDGLPKESVMGIKQGWMCCFADGYIWRHSTGIVGKDSRYIVVVLARDSRSRGSAHTVSSSTRVVQRMFPSGGIPRAHGAIDERWYALGGDRSRLGPPAGKQVTLADGTARHFERGTMYWSRGTGAHWMSGPILEAWQAQGKHHGPLGYPAGDPVTLAGGTANHFEHGIMYWSPETGAHSMSGPILKAWQAHGKHHGPLGFPASDPVALAGGTASHFQGGAMYWSPGTGANWMSGPVLEAWRAAGEHDGPLGFPTSSPYSVPEGTRVDFEHGSLTVTPAGDLLPDPTTAAAQTAPDDEAAPPVTPTDPPAPTERTSSTDPSPATDPTPATDATPGAPNGDPGVAEAPPADAATTPGASDPSATGVEGTP